MEEKNKQMQPVSIRDLFKEKNPKLAKMLPGFVYRLVSRLMHIDDINEIIEKYGNQQGMEFVHSVIKHFNIKEQIAGVENLPKEGRFIFASPHPLGGFDSMLIMSHVDKQYGRFKFLVNDVLMKLSPLSNLFLPLNKHGALDRKAIAEIDKEYSGDSQILIFPSGYASRKIKGKVMDFEWKKHFVAKAIEYKRDIIPIHVSGRNSNFFYWLANARTFLGIKWNLEMFLLPDETFKHKNRTFTVTFGKPITWQTFDNSKKLDQWAEDVKQQVYKLPELYPVTD